MKKLTIKEIINLKMYCVQNKDFELAAKLREMEKSMKPQQEVNKKMNTLAWELGLFKPPVGLYINLKDLRDKLNP